MITTAQCDALLALIAAELPPGSAACVTPTPPLFPTHVSIKRVTGVPGHRLITFEELTAEELERRVGRPGPRRRRDD